MLTYDLSTKKKKDKTNTMTKQKTNFSDKTTGVRPILAAYQF
jgi:hypothetical protein